MVWGKCHTQSICSVVLKAYIAATRTETMQWTFYYYYCDMGERTTQLVCGVSFIFWKDAGFMGNAQEGFDLFLLKEMSCQNKKSCTNCVTAYYQYLITRTRRTKEINVIFCLFVVVAVFVEFRCGSFKCLFNQPLKATPPPHF